MLSLSPTVGIWLSAQPADLRKSFDGLAALVRDGLGGDPVRSKYCAPCKDGDSQ